MTRSNWGVTGATGFVGNALVGSLVTDETYGLRLFGRQAGVRGTHKILPNPTTSNSLEGVDCLIHLAAAVGNRQSDHDLQEGNVNLSRRLAQSAVDAGVRRFVYLSSIGVHGNARPSPVGPDTPLAPHGPYTKAKAEAEQVLRDTFRHSGVKLVIVRAPMIYGPGGQGNFQRLAKLVEAGWPLPFASATLKRSFISLANIVSALRQAAICAPPHEVFLPADLDDVSLNLLTRTIAAKMGRSVRLFPVPPAVMAAGLNALGNGDLAKSLFGQLVIDRAHWTDWEWLPCETVDEGVGAAVNGATASASKWASHP